MANVKGTDAAGGGSNVNQEWVNKIAEEKWAAEQEEKRRVERVKDQSAQNKAYNDANAQKQEQLAARQRDQEQAAAQKAAQEKAQKEAAIQAAKQRANEQQQKAAQAAGKREQQAAAKAEDQRQREAAAAQAEAARDLSYSGGGISQKNQEREAEWFAPKTETPAAVTPAATSQPETTTVISTEQWTAPDNVAEVEVSTPRRSGEYRAEAQAPIVYTPQGTTEYSTREARGMAANTKAALTGEETGMSEEQLAWLNSPAGRKALADQTAREINDATLRAAAAEAQYRVGTPGEQRYDARYPRSGNTASIAGQPITADKTISGRRLTADEAAQLSGISWGGAAQPAAGSGAVRNTGLPNPQVIDRNAQVNLSNEQADYLLNPNTGPQIETPSFGEVISEMWNGRGGERTGTAADLTYTFTPPSESYESDRTVINPNVGRDSIGEWKAIQQEDQWIREGYAEAQKQPGWTERDRRAYAKYYADQKAAAEKQNQPAGSTWQEQLAERRAREAANNNSRPGAAEALDEIMNDSLNEAEKARNYRDGTAGGQRYIYRPGTTGESTTGTSGSTTGSKAGTTGTTKAGTGEARAEKQAPKGKSTYFTPSYGQPMERGVKLPYDKDGYTAKDLEAAGNKARSDQKYYTGDKAYEGYYLAPNGRYYPIDQEKAAYYKANGNSYKGWEEPMREYYQTFGTYYGYRPDWRTAGGKNIWKANNKVWENYRPAKNSTSYSRSSSDLSYTPASSGRSYGSGYTPNNGMYWNGNTRWSI